MTWNVNGIKTLPQYHPWNAYRKSAHPFEGILNHLEADIICIQGPRSSTPTALTRLRDQNHAREDRAADGLHAGL